jgi:hypothetical protein
MRFQTKREAGFSSGLFLREQNLQADRHDPGHTLPNHSTFNCDQGTFFLIFA